MKLLTAVVLCFIALTSASYAKEIVCFNNGKKIYDDLGKNIYYTENHIMFTEVRTNKRIITFADCLIKYDLKKRKGKRHASKEIGK